MAPLVRRTSRAGPLGSGVISAMRKVGESSLAGVLVCRFSRATQAAKVEYLIPHCSAKSGALKLLDSNAAEPLACMFAGSVCVPCDQI